MSQPFFRFQRFVIWHDKSSMPVGTDGVLLGAWASVHDSARILDIGTGSGLVALMAAQRAPQAQVVGIDIDEASVMQATHNAQESPFASRLTMLQADVRSCSLPERSFDTILSNPPFFKNDVLPPSKRRCQARNASVLPAAQLLASVSRLLAENGRFCVVLPADSQTKFVALALENKLYLSRVMRVRTVARKMPKRVLLEFDRCPVSETSFEELLLQSADGSRSPEYTLLTRDFYLF